MKLEQYFQSYYCQKTQDIISKLPKKFADEMAERFSHVNNLLIVNSSRFHVIFAHLQEHNEN